MTASVHHIRRLTVSSAYPAACFTLSDRLRKWILPLTRLTCGLLLTLSSYQPVGLPNLTVGMAGRGPFGNGASHQADFSASSPFYYGRDPVANEALP
jgi:hypothetical protein